IHSNSQRNGMMAMRKEDSVAIAPGQTLDFVPGGYHLMLINLKQPLRHGERVHFSLLIDGDVVQVEAPVRSVLNEPASGRHHHHGGAH
ncbi:MAG: copper chaperone PCu(A)C, partial [Spongiibacter marinus]